ERDGERPDRARDEATLAVRAGDAIRPLTALPRGLFVDLPREAGQELVVDDLFVERRVLATPALTRVVHEELALRDARRAEGVRLDDVRAGFQESAVDVADYLRLGQREQIAVVQQVLLRVREAVPADVGFLHVVAADGRAHGPVDDRDAFLEE